jgi:hypothetical protein
MCDSGHDEDSATVGCDTNANKSQVHVWSRPQPTLNSSSVHPYIRGLNGLRIQSYCLSPLLLGNDLAVGARD